MNSRRWLLLSYSSFLDVFVVLAVLTAFLAAVAFLASVALEVAADLVAFLAVVARRPGLGLTMRRT